MTRIDTARRIARWSGWAALLFVAFVTLSPIELRPHFAEANEERLGAFALIGFLFAFGYPRRVLLIAALTVCAAISLEWGADLRIRAARAGAGRSGEDMRRAGWSLLRLGGQLGRAEAGREGVRRRDGLAR